MDNIQLCYIDNEINKIDKMKQGDVIYKNGMELLVVLSYDHEEPCRGCFFYKDKKCGSKRTLTTNGSGLFDIVEGKSILQHITDNHFQHLNISKVHFDEEINKHIMQYENGYCSNDDIARIAIFAKANNLRPRMSCLLLKEGINDMNGIIRYLDYYNSLYIDNVIFRETMDYDEQAMKNHDKMAYLKNNKVYLNDIWKCIDKDNRFTPIKQLLGYYYYVEVYKYQGIDMVSESANLVKLYEQKQIANDVVFEMIFHPNGNLNGSWVDNEDILLAYNSYKS